MDELKSIDEIKNELKEIDNEPKKSLVGKVEFKRNKDKPNEIKPLETEKNNPTREIIDEIHQQAIIEQVKNDEGVQEQVLEHAKKSIQNEMDSMTQEEIKRKQETTYNANEEACKNYGIDKSVPLWQIRLMKVGSAVWFCVYWVFATIVICPISVFAKGLKSFFKQTWIVILLAIIIYLLIAVGIPMLITYLNTINI